MKYCKYYVVYSYTSPAVGIGTCEVATGIKKINELLYKEGFE